jgi:predicted nucleic acid-binding protein
MKNNILADTSIWIEFFRTRSDVGEHLASMLQHNLVWTCGIVLFDLLQGIRSEREKAVILESMQELPYIEMTQSLWNKSAALSVLIRQKGLTLPHSDIFIASIAIEHNLAIFTLDKHFEQIPEVKIYKI